LKDDSSNICILIRAYNEAPRIEATLREVCAKYSNVTVVDDGSSDGTAEIALRFPVWVIRHAVNCGAGAALQTGLRFAGRNGADVVICFDADGQHDVHDIPSLLGVMNETKADVVCGSRFLGATEGMPWLRHIVLKLGILFTRLHSGLRVTDVHNGLRALSRRSAEMIQIGHSDMTYASELYDQIQRLGLKYAEAPANIRYTDESLAKGQSSWNSLRIAAKLLLGRYLT
jgi:glycosyltransferase involved in cell wall biosynthesis